jgi:hypothetical protein
MTVLGPSNREKASMVYRGRKTTFITISYILDAWVFLASGLLIGSLFLFLMEVFNYVKSGEWVTFKCGVVLPAGVLSRIADDSLCQVLLVVSLVMLLFERFVVVPLLERTLSR